MSNVALGESTHTSDKVVICGGGVVGASVAYFLSLRGVKSTIVESNKVAGAASGKAAGFLAMDWNDSSPVGPLGRASYALHEQIASEFGAESIGYRKLDTIAVSFRASASTASSSSGSAPDWLDRQVTAWQVLGTHQTTAQVHPEKLTQRLVEASGANVVTGRVDGLELEGAPDDAGSMKGVLVDGKSLSCDKVVIAMGPWSSLAARWLPLPEISGQKYHSILLRPEPAVTAHALFTTISLPSGASAEPEVYPRPDGDVYVCGEPEAVPIPEDPAQVEVDPRKTSNVKELASLLSSRLAAAPTTKEQSCFLPISPDGLPVIGAVGGVDGAYVATGLGCWGILNSLITGKLVSELIADGSVQCGLDIRPFSPSRFVKASTKPQRKRK